MAPKVSKILVVDDSEDDRALYKRALKKILDVQYETIEAEDGDQGLAELEKETPDCVLLDYSLPGRNGIEVLKRLRAKHPFVPVVMLTGQGNETVAVTAMREGAQNYISKASVTAEDLHLAVRLAVEHCVMEKRIHEQRMSLEIFTRALAHDLKEPVRTIKSFLGLLSTQETFSDKGKGYFEYVDHAADRMAALIDAVYFYTRLEGGEQEISKEVCDVRAILHETKADLSELIRESGAVLAVGTLHDVTANPLQLRRVLQNLVSNAIRHCDKIPALRVDVVEDGAQWQIRVGDNGPGIEPEQRAKIFEPFKRLAQSAGGEHGLGLGLAICKRIVEAHGGKIWCEAGAGEGTVFAFTLPKDAAASDPIASAKHEPQPEIAQPQSPSPLANMLVVDDNEADLELAEVLLVEKTGLHCRWLTAHDGYEALSVLRENATKNQAIDLMLLDINMPGMDGFELLERLRADEALKRTAVVMCSTSSYDKDMDRARKLGVVGYMTKPADMTKLKPLLEKVSSLQLHQEPEGFTLLRTA